MGFSGELMAELATLDFKAQLQRDGVPSPAAGVDMDLVRDCIHCGLCLPKCPTFRTLHHEGDSPRGRMWQIKEATLGLVAFDDPRFQAHIYQCFNCRACIGWRVRLREFRLISRYTREEMGRVNGPIAVV